MKVLHFTSSGTIKVKWLPIKGFATPKTNTTKIESGDVLKVVKETPTELTLKTRLGIQFVVNKSELKKVRYISENRYLDTIKRVLND